MTRGFDIASVGEAGVDRLLGSIEPGLRLLHVVGEDRKEPDDARPKFRRWLSTGLGQGTTSR